MQMLNFINVLLCMHIYLEISDDSEVDIAKLSNLYIGNRHDLLRKDNER